MMGYIHGNYAQDLMLIDLSERFNISPKYCSLLFKQLSNDIFKNFLNRYRIDRAREMIEADPDAKVAELAEATGFNSSNSFIRVFERYVGMSPKAFAKTIDA